MEEVEKFQMSDLEKPTKLTITEDDINLNTVIEAITLSSTGAVCIFTGIVRGITKRGELVETDYLEYSAYESMAMIKMQQVADEIREFFPTIKGIAIVHRIGKLMPETPTVIIACAAPHRDTGVFEAARYGIDRLKQIVPIWKKQVGPDGEEYISGDYDLTEIDHKNRGGG